MLNMQNHKTTLVIMVAASVIRTLWFPLRPHSDLSANLSCSSLASCGLLTNAAASFPCLMQYLHQTCYRASNPNCSLTVVKLSVIMLRKYNNHTIIIIIISDNIEASFVLVLHGHVENKDSAVKNFFFEVCEPLCAALLRSCHSAASLLRIIVLLHGSYLTAEHLNIQC